MKCIVGLGNPGKKYQGTRHNVGYLLLDRFLKASCLHVVWESWRDLGALCELPEILLAKPATYMNESGRMVCALVLQRRISSEEILVCLDDLSLPLGKLRIRGSGSSGGHKGIQSVMDRLQTEKIPRLRIGIGPLPPGRDAVEFVLSPFSASEMTRLEEVLAAGCQAAQVWIQDGLEKAMNLYNPWSLG